MGKSVTLRGLCAIGLLVVGIGALQAQMNFRSSPTDPARHALGNTDGHRVSLLEVIPESLHAAIKDGTGTSDLRDYLSKALESRRTVVMERGVYRMDLSKAVTVIPPRGSMLIGEGPDSILDVIVNAGAAGTRTLLTIMNSHIVIRDLKIRVSRQDTGGSLILIALGGGASGFRLENVEIDGGVTYSKGLNWNVHVIKPIPGSDFADLLLQNNYIHHVNRTFFRIGTAADTGTLRRFRFVGNRFAEHFRSPISLNSPFGAFDDVLISNNSAFNNYARTAGGGTAALLALGSGSNVRVVNNHLGGVGDGIHAEEKTRGLVIKGNTIELTDPASVFGIRLVDNNVAGQVSQPQDILIEGNIIRGPGKNSSKRGVGILQANTAKPTAFWLTITGNIVAGWHRGIQITERDDAETAIVSHNQVRDNAICIWARQPMTSIADNWLFGCDVGLYARSGGMFGRNRFYAVKTWGAADSGKVTITGWETVLKPIDLPGKTTNSVDIAPIGSDLSGTLAIHWLQSSTGERRARRQISWDGARLAELSSHTVGIGPVLFSAIVHRSGHLAVDLNNTSSAAVNGGRVQAVFTGLHALN